LLLLAFLAVAGGPAVSDIHFVTTVLAGAGISAATFRDLAVACFFLLSTLSYFHPA